MALLFHKSQQKRGVVCLPLGALVLGLAGAPPLSLHLAAGCHWHSPWQGAELLSVPQRFGGTVRRSMWLFRDTAWHRPTGSKLVGQMCQCDTRDHGHRLFAVLGRSRGEMEQFTDHLLLSNLWDRCCHFH